MKKLLLVAVIISFGAVSLYAQGELNEQQKVFFRNERSFSFTISTDGYGLGYRGAKRIDYLNKRLLEIESGIIKHPKEYRINNVYAQGGSFVFGKLNLPFYLRAGLGHQHELYTKADLGGIAIRYFYFAGPTLAIYKPIYYKVLYPTGFNEYTIKIEKYNSSIALPQDIYSKASFSKGMDEIKVTPGLYLKGGFNFEYSKQDKVIHAIEIGAQLSGYIKEIPIMASPDNKAIFFSLFATYRFGMIIDPLNPDDNSFSSLFKRKRPE